MHEHRDEQLTETPSTPGGDTAASGRGCFGRLLALVLLALVLLGASAALAYRWIDNSLQQPRTFAQQNFRIDKGDTLKGFARQLQQAGVIGEVLPLTLYARYTGQAGNLHTGDYRFEDGMNLREVLTAITSGKYRLQHQFTFVQGSTFRQLRQALAADSQVRQTLQGKSDDEVLKLFDSAQRYPHPEGLFFPETYAFDPGASDVEILHRAWQMMQDSLNQLWQARAPDIMIDTPYDALILASIIEKETGLASERKQISGVFMNRLKKGMKLQTDPTVIYGLGESYDGNITRAHLTTDTPYNTYTRHGLPPTPIAMPGRAAIEAALNPDSTDAYYFVARGDGTGGHTFSRTLEEHNKAVKQYLKNRRKAG